MLNISCLLLSYENAYDCYPMSKPSVLAVLFGFHGINLFKNLVSREWLGILKNFHFSISKHFDFTFHFSKKSESILISLCTSWKRVNAFFFTLQFSKKSESFLFSLFTSRSSKTHSRRSLTSTGKSCRRNRKMERCPSVSWPRFLSASHKQSKSIILIKAMWC